MTQSATENRIYLRSNSSFLSGSSHGEILRPDHNVSPLQNSQLKNLLERVDMNSALLNLAAKDEELIKEMKNAIVTLSQEAVKRDTLYLAIEHNTKYLCELAKSADQSRAVAEKENAQMKVQISNFATEYESMTKQIRVLTKDSNQLQTERQRGV
jgi:hypothetical protein